MKLVPYVTLSIYRCIAIDYLLLPCDTTNYNTINKKNKTIPSDIINLNLIIHQTLITSIKK